MKKPLILLAFSLSLFSCDYILKKQDKGADTDSIGKENVVMGTDKDKNGCVLSAGYRWSVLKNDCVRPIEDGYRLNSVQQVEDESPVKSAFVIFDEDKKHAELYLPDTNAGIIMDADGKNVFRKGKWSLHSDKGYSLKQSGQLLYVGAQPVKEGQVTGDEDEQS